jgi:DNA-binding NarL/FixJ family response regulator
MALFPVGTPVAESGGVDLPDYRESGLQESELAHDHTSRSVPATGTWLGLPLLPRRPLSPREHQILDLIRDGNTQKEVAYRLGLSDATVRVLYARAMRKLGRPKRPLAARRLVPADRLAVSAR